jgi:hypothetical protein
VITLGTLPSASHLQLAVLRETFTAEVNCPYLFGGNLMGSSQRKAGLMAGVALMGAGLAAAPSAAHALPIRAVSVPCSVSELITAIQAANRVPASTLNLAPYCNYVLTGPAVTGTRGDDGLPIITGNITLSSNGTTIRRISSSKFRILEVAAGGVLGLRGINIAGGDAGLQTGGGILSAHGTVVLTSSAVSHNQADSGAGISNDRGGLTLVYSSVYRNTTGAGGGGGGIYNDGNLALRNSRISSNWANTSGGGLYNEQGGVTTLTRSLVNGNRARADGGGIFNNTASRVDLQSSVVSNSDAGAAGAGVFSRGTLRALQSRISVNYAGTNGGGINNGVGGTTVLYRTSVDRNVAAIAGGIFNAGVAGSVQLLQSSTVVSNVMGNCMPLGTIPSCTG